MPDDIPNNAKNPTPQGAASVPGSPNQSDPDLVTPAIAGEEWEGSSTPSLESDDDPLQETKATGAQRDEDYEHPKEVDSSMTGSNAPNTDLPPADTDPSDTT